MKIHRTFLLAAWAAFALGPFLSGETRPNLLFILVDDQRNDELGCAGDPYIQTPHIDRLASGGVRFRNMFVTTSICAASRASIFTGLTERSHGYTFGKPAVSAANSATSYPAVLKKAGYRTGFFGKYGVGIQQDQQSPMFDEMQNLHRSPYFKKQKDGTLRHVDELVGDKAVEFLQTQPSGQPFCLSLSFNIAHAEDGDKRPGIGHYPWPKAVDGMYAEVEVPIPRLRDPAIFDAHPDFLRNSMNRDRYFWRWDTPEKYDANLRARLRMLAGMDGIVGRVLGALDAGGFAENTVVFYTADNGYYRAERGFAGKWSHFEQSLRVPLIIFDPLAPKEMRGRVVDPVALNIDLPATMLDLAGVDIPEKYQGRSLKPILVGETSPQWREDFFCEHLMNHGAIPMWEGVRGTRYKYAKYIAQDPPYEFLHDLEADPDELKNFAGDSAYAAILGELREKTDAYAKEYSNPERPVTLTKSKSAAKSKAILESKPDSQGVYHFERDGFALLGITPSLGLEDNYTWEFEAKVMPGNPAGAVLLGNRETPGVAGLNFMKATASRGVQFFGGTQGKSLRLPMSLPTGKWVKVHIRKTGKQVEVSVNGKPQASGQLAFPLPAMPCYLGGDPKSPQESASCEIRNAKASSGG
jgi:arylsulfatase A-like enzyme